MKNIYVCFISILCIVLSSCAAPADKDESARAVLDYDKSTISTPIMEYSMSYQDMIIRENVVELLKAQCFARHGAVYPRLEGQSGIGETSRDYGVWNVEYTKKYGLHAPSTLSQDSFDRGVMESCLPEVKTELDKIGGAIDRKKLDYPEKLRFQAYHSATQDNIWKEYREKWWSCMKDHGLSPRTDDNAWGSAEGDAAYQQRGGSQNPASEEEIRVLTIEAQCNEDTGMARNLANLEAAYQMPLIREHQTELNDLKEQIKARTEKFQRFIAENQ